MSFFEAWLNSAEAIGKLFLIALAGFIFVRRKWLTNEALSGITRITIDVIVPCALAISMLKGFNAEVLTEASPLLLVPPIMVGLSALLAVGIFHVWKGRKKTEDYTACALACIPNSFYLPFPLVVAMVGADQQVQAKVLVGVAVLAINPLQWTLGTFFLTAGRETNERRTWKASLVQVLNGPVIGIIGGAFLALFPPLVSAARGEAGSIMPLRLLFGAMEMIGQAMAPMAMIILGALIGQCRILKSISLRLIIPIFLIRYLIAPGAIFLLIKAGEIPASGLVAFVLLLEAASAPGTNLALAARRFNGEWETASGLLLVSNTGALLILPFWMAAALQL